MNKGRSILGVVGLLMLVLAFWMMGPGAEQGLEILHTEVNGSPVLFIGPADALDGSRPLVLIGHGFAGSTALMRSFALPLAHAGYVTALWDFDGHGANPNPMSSDPQRTDLTAAAEAVQAEAARRGLYSPDQVAILGHSMGSGAALRFGQAHPETTATIAVSPVGVNVTPELPHNLLLLAGQNETGFVRNAEKLLEQAGGAGGDPAAGTARKLVIIPFVEHISILFHDQSHAEARAWLDASFGVQPGAQTRPSRIILWYGVGILGTLLAAAALAPATPFMAMTSQPFWRRLVALILGAFGATVGLVILGKLGLNLSTFLGVLVGGFLAAWFALAGLIALVLLRKEIPRLSLADWRVVLAGLIVFAFLWVGVGLLGNQVWVAWLLIPERLLRWVLGTLGFLPWMLAVGLVSAPANAWGRLGWWLAHSLIMVVALFAAMQFSTGLGFLFLILPLFPFMLGFHALAAGRQGSAWAFGISGAMFLSWLVMAVFPLQ